MNPLATAVLAVAVSVGASPGAESVRGTYHVEGTARVDAGPVLSRQTETSAEVELRPAARPGEVAARVTAEGRACELVARLAPDGVLLFAAGQRCVFPVDEPEARGRVEGRLRSGRGRATGGTLALELTFELSGALSVRTARRVEVFGREVELPAAWTPEVPVRGEAHATAGGSRVGAHGR